MAQLAGFLPSTWETQGVFAAPSLGSAPAIVDLGDEPEDRGSLHLLVFLFSTLIHPYVPTTSLDKGLKSGSGSASWISQMDDKDTTTQTITCHPPHLLPG